MGSHEDHYLRQFVAARRAGDAQSMRHWWGELLTVRMHWVRTRVQIEAAGRLSKAELEDAVQQASIKIAVKMQENFTGTSMGEWVTYAKRVIHGSNVDVQRAAERVNRAVVPLDRVGPDGDESPTGADRAAIREAARDLADLEADDERLELLARGNDFFAWALPQLNARHRRFVVLEAYGATTAELRTELGVSRDVVYKTRERAYNHLDQLMRDYES